MRVFRVALTGDFLDETGAVAYGEYRPWPPGESSLTFARTS